MKTIEMARSTGIRSPDLYKLTVGHMSIDQLERFVALARADEFEACARLCDARVMGDNNREDMEAKRCAADIRSFRARSNR